MLGTPLELSVLIILNGLWRRQDMETVGRKLILVTALVLAIGFGRTAMIHAADVGKTAPNPSWHTPETSGSSQHPQAAANLSKGDITEAQLELRHLGLYSGAWVFTAARSTV